MAEKLLVLGEGKGNVLDQVQEIVPVMKSVTPTKSTTNCPCARTKERVEVHVVVELITNAINRIVGTDPSTGQDRQLGRSSQRNPH